MDGSEIRYTRSGDVDIAWTVTGRGPIDIVYVAGFISHLDQAREVSAYGSLLGRLDRVGRILAFDKRGTGLSGRDLGFGSLAERADDIRHHECSNKEQRGFRYSRHGPMGFTAVDWSGRRSGDPNR